jgi:two-component system sensor histidine kinase ArlS
MALNLKQRFSVAFSLLFSILLGAVLIIIFALYAQFRHQDFRSRLADQLETDLKLFVDVNKADSSLVDLVERDAISHLVNEGVYIFDDQLHLLYEINHDFPSTIFRKQDLRYLEENSKLTTRIDKYDVFGMTYRSGGKTFYAIIEAEDIDGNNKLNYLKFLLSVAYGCGVISVWFLSFYLSKRSLRPFDVLTRKIQNYSDPNLKTRLTVSPRKDEIDGIATAFNLMMDRIDLAYSKQREFTGNASHELRTPLSRITSRISNLRENKKITPEHLDEELREINDEVYQMADMVSSLLLLSKISNEEKIQQLPAIRLDELLFDCMNEKSLVYSDLKFNFDIASGENQSDNFEIHGDESLVRIAILNIIKNGYLYSNKKELTIILKREGAWVIVEFINPGKNPNMEDLNDLFRTFSRADNSNGISGTGIGLSIVKRVVDYHRGEATFTVPQNEINCVTLKLKAGK